MHLRCVRQYIHELVTRVAQLEVGRGGGKLIDETADVGRQPRVLVALQIRLEIILVEPFVNLEVAC